MRSRPVADAFALTEQSLADLKGALTEFAAWRKNQQNRRSPGRGLEHWEEHQAPEVYVVRTPRGGVSGLTDEFITGTGTGTEKGGIEDETGEYEPDVCTFLDCEVFRVLIEDNPFGPVGTTGDPDTLLPHLQPIDALNNKLQRVYNLHNQPIPGNIWTLAVRDKAGKYFFLPPADRLLVELTDKILAPHTLGGFRAYNWKEVVDSDKPLPITYDDTWSGWRRGLQRKGGYGGNGAYASDFPAYDLNDVDYPTPYTAYIYRGRGDYYLIDGEPRIEIVRKASSATGVGTGPEGIYASGFIQRWDQNSRTFVDDTPVFIVDANSV